MKLYTKAQVLEDIEKGTTDEVVQSHIDSVLKGWEEGKDDFDLQFSYDVICSNSKSATVPEIFAPYVNHEQLLTEEETDGYHEMQQYQDESYQGN